VQQRTREIGIRLALGARVHHIVATVVSTAAGALIVGLALGVAGSLATSIVLRHFLYGLSPLDPLTYLGVAALLTAAGLLASWLPARRALRVAPNVALRYE
jgi:putative ABC transport system permease protein